MDKTTRSEMAAPAVGSPVGRMVRAHDPDRAAFERWCHDKYGAEAYRHTSACCGEWDAWQAARPNLAAVGTLVNIAAELAQHKPVRALDLLSERSGRTLGRASLDDALAGAHDGLGQIAMRVAEAARAL